MLAINAKTVPFTIVLNHKFSGILPQSFGQPQGIAPTIRAPFKSSEQLFREWNEVDFPKRKPNVGFGKSAPLHSRNNCQLLL